MHANIEYLHKSHALELQLHAMQTNDFWSILFQKVAPMQCSIAQRSTFNAQIESQTLNNMLLLLELMHGRSCIEN